MSNKLYTMPLFSIFIKSLGEINFNFMPSLYTKYTISVRYVENDKVPPINKKKTSTSSNKNRHSTVHTVLCLRPNLYRQFNRVLFRFLFSIIIYIHKNLWKKIYFEKKIVEMNNLNKLLSFHASLSYNVYICW